MDEKGSVYQTAKRKFSEFLDPDSEDGIFAQKIREMVADGRTRLVVSLNDLRVFDTDLAQKLLTRPTEHIPPFEDALQTHISANIQIGQSTTYKLGFTGSFGRRRITPRGLVAKYLSQLVCVEGIVTKCSVVRPSVVSTTHYAPATNEMISMTYADATSFTKAPTSGVYPTKDNQGNRLETEFGLSVYQDNQTITIQEMPERAPAGQLPRAIDVILFGDLVDSCKPGDRVQTTAVYRGLAGKAANVMSGILKTALIANYVVPVLDEDAAKAMTEVDVRNIRDQAKKRGHFARMAKSLCPSIFGHEYIKKAILLLLLGGVERNLANKTHIRGDINMLMVGDPSTAKSQLLRAVMHIAPLAISTTGRGSSGVGLTAAVTTDKDTNEKRLEAGAMVLADRGVVCIDEFDKMNEIDRVSIHEVMEQQTVSIAKAGIHTSLNARCSIVAAANPVYGMYDESENVAVNVGLADSLLSRFDLLFVVRDECNPEIDRCIAEQVLANHRFKRVGGDDQCGLNFDDDAEKEVDTDETPVFQSYNRLLHGRVQGGGRHLFSLSFIKKFLQFAKSNYKPVLTEDASNYLTQVYADLRRESAETRAMTLPITARAFETLIRLSTAHARCRLSHNVTERDAKVAIEVLRFALTNEVSEDLEVYSSRDMHARRRRRQHIVGDDDDDDNTENYSEEGDDARQSEADSMDTQHHSASSNRSKSQQQQSQSSQSSSNSNDDPFGFEHMSSEATQDLDNSMAQMALGDPKKREGPAPDLPPSKKIRVDYTQEELKKFQSSVANYFDSNRVQEATFSQLVNHINQHNPSPFSHETIEAMIQGLGDKVMYRNGIVYSTTM